MCRIERIGGSGRIGSIRKIRRIGRSGRIRNREGMTRIGKMEGIEVGRIGGRGGLAG